MTERSLAEMDAQVDRVKKAMGAVLIPGSVSIPAEMVISRELLDSMARAAVAAMQEPIPAFLKKREA